MPEVDLDLSEFDEVGTTKGPRCTACRALESLSEEDRVKLDAALLVKTGKQISVWLAKRGLRVSPYVVNRHRRGECLGR